MLQTIASLITILFFIWILPLGFFIKPSQEKLACNGQRAICLCSHTLAKEKAEDKGRFNYKAPTNGQKEANASGGASHHYVVVNNDFLPAQQLAFYHHELTSLYSLLLITSIEHVPLV